MHREIESRAEDLARDLAVHVAIPTGTGYVTGLDEYRDMVRARLESLGATIELLPGEPRPAWLTLPGQPPEPPAPVLVARREVPGARPRVLISGHLDTVHDPHDSFRALTIEPDGVLARGPGAVDMKGGVVIALAALEILAAHDVELSWTMVLNSDEETGSYGSAAALRRVASGHDFGVVLEPALADGALAVERMGSGHFMVEIRGRAAHVGREFTAGISAVTALGGLLEAIAAMADPGRGRIVNVGPLRGGSVLNTVPDSAACWGNARFTTAEAGEDLGRRLDALATPDGALPAVIVHRAWSRPAKPCTPAVRAFAGMAQVAAADLGQALPFASTGGVCDGNILQDAGLPTLDTLGVRGGNLHRRDEFVEMASLVERCQLLASVLSRLADGSGPDVASAGS
ncbi:MAG: M20/M25/M40 family metallo-hydrolase [Planctomycetota bacterium]|jgi:glutamate carboxypeptidase